MISIPGVPGSKCPAERRATSTRRLSRRLTLALLLLSGSLLATQLVAQIRLSDPILYETQTVGGDFATRSAVGPNFQAMIATRFILPPSDLGWRLSGVTLLTRYFDQGIVTSEIGQARTFDIQVFPDNGTRFAPTGSPLDAVPSPSALAHRQASATGQNVGFPLDAAFNVDFPPIDLEPSTLYWITVTAVGEDFGNDTGTHFAWWGVDGAPKAVAAGGGTLWFQTWTFIQRDQYMALAGVEGGPPIFVDGFESGSTCAWGGC